MILFLFAAFGVAVTGTVAATARLRVHPVLPLLFSAFAFGLAGDMSFAYTVRSMGEGFAATVSSIGIVLVASSIATTFLERSGGSERLAQALSCTAGRTRGPVAMALL